MDRNLYQVTDRYRISDSSGWISYV